MTRPFSHPSDVAPDPATARLLAALRGDDMRQLSLTPTDPLWVATVNDQPILIGLRVPDEPVLPEGSRLVGYVVRTIPNVRPAAEYPRETLAQATRALLMLGIRCHAIHAVVQSDDVTWRAEWSHAANRWERWRIV